MLDDERPLFRQVAQSVEDSILTGALRAGERAPSTNELVAFYRINPATAARGIALLVERGILHKRRGIGMFVADEALEVVRAQRREELVAGLLRPLLHQAANLGLSEADVIRLVREHAQDLDRPTAEGGGP